MFACELRRLLVYGFFNNLLVFFEVFLGGLYKPAKILIFLAFLSG
jgi:hypothetical protein